MANATHISPAHTSGFGAKLNSFFAGLSNGMVAYMERRTRFDQIAALQAKSDAELAKLGINRDQIPAHVFRDLFYV
ncbi:MULTISPECIES: DUF1127 domain-containing protein [Rhodobacterales]|uniref:DUF1127 domain-containing protein n=1 Tax=Rhodobacterales TaxID=204455 RepID=UPI001430235A|nr:MULTISPECIES: DUF1127 domain-containing protein [Rhodobacterales]NIZ11006.1 DUF1127 domain-containing protein [Pseudooceanicola sp. HF7]NVL02188.1 DUF1127 domain-containing protein [Ruegeria pomeroyi]